MNTSIIRQAHDGEADRTTTLSTGFEPVIGLEVHVELKTKSKMFCGCPADFFGKEPNTQTCPVCLGLPGALPVPNKKAVEWTILLGLALGCKVNLYSKFDRKNYFYPDIPKGYQISQYDKPLATGGSLKIKNQNSNIKNGDEEKTIRINRVHLEEDTGKLLHSDQIPNYCGPGDVSLIDFNRSGVPLVEIVTEPDFSSSEQAKEYLKKLQQIIRYLDISDADMEKGSMRIEPSISLREINIKNQNTLRPSSGQANLKQSELPDYKVEVKNINSFRFAQKAIDYEIARQKEILLAGQKVVQETRGWNEAKQQTVSQRSKEQAHEYRYFPEPDIPPMIFTKSQITNLKSQIPELPEAKIERYIKDWSMKEPDAQIIVADKDLNKLFEEAATEANNKGLSVSKLASLIVNKKIEVAGKSVAELIKSAMEQSQKPVLNDKQIIAICGKIIEENIRAVEEYRSGKADGLKYLLGLVMKETRGGAEPEKATKILESKINSTI